jgi:hypothetical protein
MLRKATFYAPNFLPNFEHVVVNPEGFVARETPVYYDYNNYFYKKGGKIKKYQTPADVMVGTNEVKKASQYGFTFDSLTPEEKEEFKRLKLEAEKNGTDLIFKGQNFGKISAANDPSKFVQEEIKFNDSTQTPDLGGSTE